MRFTVAAAAAIFTALSSATAIPQGGDVCHGGSYEQCLASVLCIQSWPESCECANQAMIDCGKACHGDPPPRPPLQDCSVPPKQKRDCTGGSFEACVNDVFCIQSWPESCICRNKALVDCEDACHDLNPGRVELQDCTVPPEPKPEPRAVKDGRACYNECLEGLACIQVWPQSCICANNHKQQCASQCNITLNPGELQNCG